MHVSYRAIIFYLVDDRLFRLHFYGSLSTFSSVFSPSWRHFNPQLSALLPLSWPRAVCLTWATFSCGHICCNIYWVHNVVMNRRFSQSMCSLFWTLKRANHNLIVFEVLHRKNTSHQTCTLDKKKVLRDDYHNFILYIMLAYWHRLQSLGRCYDHLVGCSILGCWTF